MLKYSLDAIADANKDLVNEQVNKVPTEEQLTCFEDDCEKTNKALANAQYDGWSSRIMGSQMLRHRWIPLL